MTSLSEIETLVMEGIRNEKPVSPGLVAILFLLGGILPIFLVTLFFVVFMSSFTSPSQTVVLQPYTLQFPGYFLAIFIAFLGVFIILAAIVIALLTYVFHRWIEYRNRHFTRSRKLYQTLYEYLIERYPEDEAKLERYRASVETYVNWKRGSMSSLFWGFISLIFGLYMILLSMLGMEHYTHTRYEGSILRNLNEYFIYKTGDGLPIPNEQEYRDPLVHSLITIITFGVFGIYWAYVISSDQMEHYKSHKEFEERLLSKLRELG